MNDSGGYWWPLAMSTWTTTIVSLSFSVSLIVAQFTIFSSFSIMNFQSHFEALNDFFWENREQHGSMDECFSSKSCSSWVDISNEILCVSNGGRMPKLQPWEVDVPIYPNGAHSLAFHLLGLGFWMFRDFHCFSIINRPLSLIVTQFRGMQPPHLFSEISYHRLSWFISNFVCKHISVFYINEMKYYFHCISVFIVISVICCVPV